MRVHGLTQPLFVLICHQLGAHEPRADVYEEHECIPTLIVYYILSDSRAASVLIKFKEVEQDDCNLNSHLQVLTEQFELIKP